jgi:hypothetical protein
MPFTWMRKLLRFRSKEEEPPRSLIDQVIEDLERLPERRVRPLTEGYVRKGGLNHGPSQITKRPPPPAPINVKKPS